MSGLLIQFEIERSARFQAIFCDALPPIVIAGRVKLA